MFKILGRTVRVAARVIVGLVGMLALIGLVFGRQPSRTSATDAATSPDQKTAPQAATDAKAGDGGGKNVYMPSDESKFVLAVEDFAQKYKAGPNDMVKGVSRVHRKEAICALLQDKNVHDWLGHIRELSSTSEGYGVLSVTLDGDVSIGTTNNQLSESLSEAKTLIMPDDPLFEKVSALHEDDVVRVSGRFFSADPDCIEENSLTQEGSMTAPDFLFRFTSVEVVK